MDGVKLEEQLRSSFESAIHEPRGGLSEELDVLVSSEDDDPIFSMATGVLLCMQTCYDVDHIPSKLLHCLTPFASHTDCSEKEASFHLCLI